RREVPRQELRARGLYALQLCGGADHQSCGGSGEFIGSQEGRRSHAFGAQILDRNRRHQLRPEGRRHPARLCGVCLEEGRERQCHLRGASTVGKTHMTKEEISFVLEKVRSWPQEDQEEIAEIAREIEARRSGMYILSDDERCAIERARNGSFASEDEVSAFWKRHGIT